MKSNTIYAFLVTLTLILSGCGSNDKVDYSLDDVGSDVYQIEAGKLTMTNLSFETILPFTKSVEKDVTVELSDFDLTLTGCDIASVSYSPEPLVLDGSNSSQKLLTISGTVVNDCNATAYSLSADKKVSLAGASTTENGILVLSTTLDEDGNPGSTIDPSIPTVDGNYSFYNIPSIPTITKAEQVEFVRIQVIDSNLDYPSGMSVRFEPFDNRFGEMVNMKVTTDDNGYANFEYHSPKTLPSVNEPLPLTVLLEDDNGTKLDSAEIALSFDATVVQPNDYRLLYGKSITVTNANQKDSITVNLLDSTGNGIADKEIKASILPPAFGTLLNGVATTTDTGLATFSYKAPSDLSSVNGRSIDIDLSFTDENSDVITTTVSVSINASNTTPTSYNLTYAKSIIVTNEGQEESITVNLLDSAGNGIAGKEIKASILPPAFGTLLNGAAMTTDTGLATFSYKAPDDIATVNGQTQNITLTFTDESGTPFTAITTIFIMTSASGAFELQVIPEESNITADREAKPINVFVKNSVGEPASDVQVNVEYFNPQFGTMNKYKENTDSNGRVEFVYVAPEDITPLDGQTFDFNVSLASSPTTTQSITLGFNQSVELSSVDEIYLAPSEFTVVRAGETRTIKVTAVDSNNFGISTELKIENPTQAGKDYGSFDVSNFSTDEFGNRLITYTAPTILSNLDQNRTITVVELSTGKEENLTISFQQPASEEVSYELNISVEDSIPVDGKGTLGINIHEAGKPNDYITSTDVRNVTATMKFPKMLTFDGNVPSITYANANINSFALFAGNISGVAIIEVEAIVFNGVREVTLSQEFPVVINSGDISSISMYHTSTSFENGKYEDFYTLHAVDKYGNPVNEGTALHPTLINGTKAEGDLGAISAATPSTFTDISADFSSVIDTAQTGGDRLIVIPSSGKTSKFYMGDWSIASHTLTALTLEEQFDGVDTSGLTYVVGNESRTVIINGKEVISLADISSPDDNFQTDAQGNMQFVVSYDPALKGKTFYLAANGPSAEKRIGTALKSSFFYGGYQLRALINEITLTSPGDSFFTGYYVLDSVGNTYNGQFNALIDNFDGSKGGFIIDNGAQSLTYSAPSNPDEFNLLVGTTYEFNLTISETDETFETIRVHFEDPIDYTNYKIESSESNFTISTPNEQHILEYYLSDGNKPVIGQEIRVGFIEPLRGSFNDYTAITDGSGKATFTYTAPSDISQLFGNPLTINAFFSNQSSIDVNVTALFAVEVPVYDLINVSDITITHGSQKEDIKAQLTYKGVPIAGKTVNMIAFSKSNGSILDGFSVTTDNVGYATFTYMAPETLDDVNGTTLNLTIQFNEDGVSLEENATVFFKETVENIEGNVSLPIVVIPLELRETILDSNSKTIAVPIKVFKDISPFTEGSVKVELPQKVFNGVDVGQFNAYEVDVNDQGIAEFVYTGPSNLQALVTNDDNDSTFNFYHIDNSQNKQEMKVLYQLPPDNFISRNYELEIITSGEFSMGIPEQEKTFNVLLKAKDSAGNDVSLTTENITRITALTTNSTIAQILNTATSTLVNSLELNAANNSPFILKSKQLSGLVPIEVSIEFDDANGDPQSLSTIVNVRVFSGPASAISISYVSTGQDTSRAKYIEKLAVSATDEYGNKVNTQPNITLGAVVGYAVDGNETSANETSTTKRLFYGRSDIEASRANGEIIQLGGNKANFEENTAAMSNVFRYVNAEGNNTDKLVIFGEQKNYEAMGKWDFTAINTNTLELQDDYYGVDRDGLYYAVGHNYYQDQCREDGREWVGSTDSDTYQLDEEGTVVIDYKYDYHLGGKDALIWVNLDGIQPDTGEITRIGEANKAPLRTAGLTSTPTAGYTLSKGTAAAATFSIWHENAPERFRNAKFGYDIAPGSTCTHTRIASSNDFDARTCNNRQTVDHDNNTTTADRTYGTTNGSSYVTFYLEAPIDKDCTFNIENITVASEF